MSVSCCPSRWWLPPRSHSTGYGLPLVIYTFLFVSSTPHTTRPSPFPPTAHPRPPPTHHGTRCMSGSGSLYFQVFVCGVSSPAAQWPVLEREKTREAEKAERGRGSCGQASGSRGESEILKRHKGRPHALKGNNSFTTEADSTWSDVWKFVCLLATRPIDFFSNRFFSFFTLLFLRSFFRASLIRITFILSNSRTTYIGVRTDGPAC